MENLKLYYSELNGTDENELKTFEIIGTGFLVQFHQSDNINIIEHDEDEYLYYSTHYGLSEIYEDFKANNYDEALIKMMKLNDNLDKEFNDEN